MKSQRLLILFISLMGCSTGKVNSGHKSSMPVQQDAYMRATYYQQQMLLNLDLAKHHLQQPDTIKYIVYENAHN